MDYVDILEKLNKYWELETMGELNEEAEKARDYLCKLPKRLAKISERMKVEYDANFFTWVSPDGMMV